MPTTNYLSIGGELVSQSKAGVRTDLLSDPTGNVIGTIGAGAVVSNRTTYWPKGEIRTGGVAVVCPFGLQASRQVYTRVSLAFSGPYVLSLTVALTVVSPQVRSTKRPDGRPILPNGASYVNNCCIARANSYNLTWFYKQVKKGAPWDYKQFGDPLYQEGGNFNFGFVAACMGLSLGFITRAAGGAQLIDGNAGSGRGDFVTPPFYDEPKDHNAIVRGYNDALKWMAELERKCVRNMAACYKEFVDRRDKQISDDLERGGVLGAPNRWWVR